MKFTPEEMAIDAADVDASKPPALARLDADVRKAFPTDAAVNEALRLMTRKDGKSTTTRKKSA